MTRRECMREMDAAIAIDLERQFSANFHRGHGDAPEVMTLDGPTPILITAPHATNHLRRETVKLADTYTGAMALLLARHTGTPAIVLPRTTGEDPNYSESGPFKDAVARTLAGRPFVAVLDLHGMARSRPWDVAIGTASGRTLGNRRDLLDMLVANLRANGIDNLLLEDPRILSAGPPNTIASFVWREAGVPAMQIEINKRFRDPSDAPDSFERMLAALASTILDMG